MFKSLKPLICLLMSALALLTAGCAPENKTESEATQPQPSATEAASSTTAPPATTEPQMPASSDSAIADDSSITYNSLEIKRSLNEIENTFDGYIDYYRFNGSVYCKIGNDFDYIKTRGFANAGAHIDNSIYRSGYAGSVTKLFTAVAALKLAEEKKLGLDKTIEAYFPDYPYGKEITVRQLLNMTSGIPDYICRSEGFYNGLMPVPELKDKLESGAYSDNKSAVLDWILSQPRSEQKNTFRFSNSNYYLLGEIIASASGMTYEEYIESAICKPLFLTKTGFNDDETIARPYHSYSVGEQLLYEGAGYSSLGIITNISDLLKYIDALLGKQIIGEASLKEMMTDNGSGYGFGVYLNGNRASCIGNIDAYSAKVSFTADKSQIFAAMTNDAYSDPNLLHRLFRNYLLKFRN